MKIQDIVFIVFFIFLLLSRQPKLFVIVGLFCLVIAIPLFATWTFYTAERMTWYAGAYFLSYILISILWPLKIQ